MLFDTINHLDLPRYGLGNYVESSPHDPPTQAEAKALADLSRAGKRLMAFCRTNLFKRLESSGQALFSPWSATSCGTTFSCTPSRTA